MKIKLLKDIFLISQNFENFAIFKNKKLQFPQKLNHLFQKKKLFVLSSYDLS